MKGRDVKLSFSHIPSFSVHAMISLTEHLSRRVCDQSFDELVDARLLKLPHDMSSPEGKFPTNSFERSVSLRLKN